MSEDPTTSTAMTPSALSMYKALIPSTMSTVQKMLPVLLEAYNKRAEVVGPNLQAPTSLVSGMSPFEASMNSLLKSAMPLLQGLTAAS